MPLSRRQFLRLPAAAAVPTVSAAASTEAPRRPNLLFLWTDQHRGDTVPWAGDTVVRAPALHALAERSFVFDGARVAQPLCTPSRASILTGTWPHHHGCVRNHDALPAEFATIGACAPADYLTAYFGKWHLGDEIRVQHGFREWLSIDDSYWEDYTHPEDRRRFSDYHRFLVSKGFPPDDEDEGPPVPSGVEKLRRPVGQERNLGVALGQ